MEKTDMDGIAKFLPLTGQKGRKQDDYGKHTKKGGKVKCIGYQ